VFDFLIIWFITVSSIELTLDDPLVDPMSNYKVYNNKPIIVGAQHFGHCDILYFPSGNNLKGSGIWGSAERTEFLLEADG
jgi:hypothetical protein